MVHSEAASLLPQGWQLLLDPPHSTKCKRSIEHVHSHMDEETHSWLLQCMQLYPNTNATPQRSKGQYATFECPMPASRTASDITTLPDTWEAFTAVGGNYTALELS
jgi:hypothetical protein